MPLMFRRTKAREARIDNYLDQVFQGILIFERGVGFYLDDSLDDCERCVTDLSDVEELADQLRLDIEAQLYSETLIPESRGDVLGLLESIDNVLDEANETLGRFTIERPLLSAELCKYMRQLVDATARSVESMVSAVRAYFVDLSRVRDHSTKARFFEQEGDRISAIMMREAFSAEDVDMGHKLHQRSMVKHIEQISDLAEDVCDRLSLAVIKRYD